MLHIPDISMQVILTNMYVEIAMGRTLNTKKKRTDQKRGEPRTGRNEIPV